MRVFVLLVLFFSFLMSDVDTNESNEIFLRLNTEGHTSRVWDVIVTKDKKEFVTASDDKTIRVWDIKTGKEKRKILGEISAKTGQINAIALSPNNEILLVGGLLHDNTNYRHDIRVYNFKTGKIIKILKGHINTIYDIDFSSDGKYFVSSSADNIINLWDTNKLDLIDTIEGNISKSVYSVEIIKKDSDYFVISAGMDKHLKLYSLNQKRILKDVKLEFPLYSVATNGKHIAVSSQNEDGCFLYDFNLTKIKQFNPTSSSFLLYSKDGEKLIAGTTGSTGIAVFDTKKYEIVNLFSKHTNLTRAIDFVNNQTVISVGGGNQEVYIWNITHDQRKADVIFNDKDIVENQFMGIGKRIYNLGIKKKLIGFGNNFNYTQQDNSYEKLFDLNTLNVLDNKYSFDEIKKNYQEYTLFLKDTKTKYSDSLEVRKDNKIVAVIKDEIRSHSLNCYGFYRNYIITAGMNGWLRIYDLKGREVASLVGHEGEIYSINVSEDKLISGGIDQVIRVWDIKNIISVVKKNDYYKFRVKDRNEEAMKEEKEYLLFKYSNIKDLNSKEFYNKFVNDYGYNLANLMFESKEFYPMLNIFIAHKHNESIPNINKLKEIRRKFFNEETSLETVAFFMSKIVNQPYKFMNYISKEHSYIVWTHDGFFTSSSAEAIEYIYFHLNQGYNKAAKEIPMKSLYDHFFKPDLINVLIDGKDISKYTKGLTYKTALQNPPPTVKIKNQNNKVNQEKIKLAFDIKDNKGGIGLIRIYQEGKLIQTIGEGKVNKQSANIDTLLEQNELDKANQANQKVYFSSLISRAIDDKLEISDTVANQKSSTVTNRAGEYEIEVDLISGKNEIAIEAFNKTNTVASFRESIVIEADIPKKEPKLYAIVVGVDEFEHKPKKFNLNYAQNDAQSVKQEIENRIGKTFNETEVKYLIGKEVTKTNILNAAKEIAQKAKLEDTIIFYISTHGRVVKGDLYFMPYNNNHAKNYIDFQETFRAIQSIKALNQIFIVDACESGKANDIVSAVYDSRASVLAKSAGVHMLLATTKGAYAFEPNPEVKGVKKVETFTQRVLKAMNNKASDINGDGYVSIVELSDNLKANQESVAYQYPVIRNVGGDIRLVGVE